MLWSLCSVCLIGYLFLTFFLPCTFERAFLHVLTSLGRASGGAKEVTDGCLASKIPDPTEKSEWSREGERKLTDLPVRS